MIIYCLVWNEICPTMILSSPIRGTYFSFHSLENLTRIKGKKHRFFHLSCLYHTQFEFHRSLEIKVYRCQTIQRRFVMQIHFFLSWNRFFQKKSSTVEYIFPTESPPFDPRDEILRFGARDSPTFAIYETFRVLGNSEHGTVGSLYDFFLLSSLYYPFNGRIISCGWKNTSCKNLKTFNYSILIVRISFPFRGFIG